MTEVTKTMVFVGVALATTVLALVSRPRPVGIEPDEQIGQPLFEEFTDPLAAKSLEIVKFDEDLGRLDNFKVAEQGEGVWGIPSHQGYPADAENRLQDAATMFVDLDVVNVVSEEDGDHPIFGVVEPDKEKVALGDTGVGTLVTLQDGSNKNIVQLIIGKEVKDSEGKHYVRLPSRSRVYEVSIDPSKLSTKFADWIETDLLGLNTFDIETITLKDYSVEVGRGPQGLAITNYDQRLSLTTHREDSGDWVLDEFLEIQGDALTPTELLEGEELNKERLDTLRDSLDDLKIVDVERKPKGMGADLKADKGFLNDREGMASLIERGFYPVPVSDDETDLWSSDGEVLVNTKDGVQYVLRFGQVAGIDRGETEDGESQSSVNRFLFVTARVNEEQFPMPELEPLPEAASDETEDETDEDSESEQQEAAAESDDDQAEADDEGGDEEAAVDPAADAEDAAEADDDTSEESSEAEDDGEQEQDLAEEISRVNRENQRKLDERQDKVDEAKKKVAELNYRFADWYYVISEDVFKKIHLSRDDIITMSEESKKAGSGLDAFRGLENKTLGGDGETD